MIEQKLQKFSPLTVLTYTVFLWYVAIVHNNYNPLCTSLSCEVLSVNG